MASYSVIWEPKATKELKRLPKPEIARILKAVAQLAHNPYPVGSLKLSGEESSYRIRQGNYRIIYTIENHQLLVAVVRVGHRREVYRGELG
jgi:mRNA interferase RelE/StbE